MHFNAFITFAYVAIAISV